MVLAFDNKLNNAVNLEIQLTLTMICSMNNIFTKTVHK